MVFGDYSLGVKVVIITGFSLLLDLPFGLKYFLERKIKPWVICISQENLTLQGFYFTNVILYKTFICFQVKTLKWGTLERSCLGLCFLCFFLHSIFSFSYRKPFWLVFVSSFLLFLFENMNNYVYSCLPHLTQKVTYHKHCVPLDVS